MGKQYLSIQKVWLNRYYYSVSLSTHDCTSDLLPRTERGRMTLEGVVDHATHSGPVSGGRVGKNNYTNTPIPFSNKCTIVPSLTRSRFFFPLLVKRNMTNLHIHPKSPLGHVSQFIRVVSVPTRTSDRNGLLESVKFTCFFHPARPRRKMDPYSRFLTQKKAPFLLVLHHVDMDRRPMTRTF